MATYYIYRKDRPGLTASYLDGLAHSFRHLYCGPFQDSPKLKIVVRGEWPDHGRDGLFLSSGAEVTEVGRKLVTVLWSENGQEYSAKIKLCPTSDTGYREIMFITTH